MRVGKIRNVCSTLCVVIWIAIVGTATAQAQILSGEQLVAALREGGHVIVMRHANSPRVTPGEETANPDNVDRERQLDGEGRETSRAMGNAVRTLGIPIGDVLLSPTYRAQETANMAGFTESVTEAELGDRGRSMQGVTETDAQWLRDAAARFPGDTNTLLVTHSPNISAAFPEVTPGAADGEALIFRPDEDGGTVLVGRVRIEEWPELN